ncbi:Uncharacterised protein [Mycobacteroides abscessus]|nr:Uncharacterised protein [Mycobacteroides abscessus]SHQ37147.1 Uncharacterised protein [Mycobacteroides abscessus subsp. abscessus]CPS50636.1 Uncharacterised protein [Mycobacteroides abscessus]CPS93550.1 Uncharacterised protein [Mycobacteroides abscessus]CPS94406.1 Uncharacterised protein [Mycobacteroides abscessus]
MRPRNALTKAFAPTETLSHGRDTEFVTVRTRPQVRPGHTEYRSGHLPSAGLDTCGGGA